MTWLIAQLHNRCDFSVEYHEIKKEHEIVSNNTKVVNVRFALHTHLLICFKLANLGTEMLDRTHKFLSRQLDGMYLGWVEYVRGNELTLPYYVLT